MQRIWAVPIPARRPVPAAPRLPAAATPLPTPMLALRSCAAGCQCIITVTESSSILVPVPDRSSVVPAYADLQSSWLRLGTRDTLALNLAKLQAAQRYCFPFIVTQLLLQHAVRSLTAR